MIDDKARVARPCDCGLLERVHGADRARGARIPPRFSRKDFENYSIDAPQGGKSSAASAKARKEILAVAEAYARGFNTDEREGFILRGPTGCGKTHIAVAILKAVIRRGYTGVYFNFTDLLSRIRDSYQEDGTETEGALLNIVDSCDLLVLDDVGAERASEFVRDRLYLIINRRYENARPIIITTNLDDDEMRERVGERTASRLCEMCAIPFPPFPAQDYRRAMMH
ncbi:MAG: ATP-binding protein [Candidatus Sumerlaeia bacterium]|nr:ATP-binding protein [Candidatus Sumerlaeia bacterium]